MIRLLYDTTIGGVRFGQGALVELDSALEDGLIAEGDATRAINFSSDGLLPQRIAQSYAPVTRSSNNATDTAWVVLDFHHRSEAGQWGSTANLSLSLTGISRIRQAPKRWPWIGAAERVWARLMHNSAGVKLMIEIINANSLVLTKDT